MDNNTLAIYIHELRNQCLHTQASFDLFNQAVMNKAATGVLYGGQLILMPGSQIASLLWPTRARARARGEALRKVLQLPEKHPLNDRRLCELWERSDEKIEEWIANTKGQQVVFDFVGDLTQLGNGNTPEECIYRAYNPGTNVFYHRGVGYNLKAVADAISDVAGRVNAVYRQLFPEHAKAEDEARQKAMEAQQAAAAAQQQPGTAASTAAANDPVPEPIDLSAGPETAEAKPAPKKKAAAKKPAEKKAPAKKAPTKKAAAKKTPAKKAAKKAD